MKPNAKALIISPMVHVMIQSRRCFSTLLGFSLIKPVVTSVMAEMNRNAKGRDAVVLSNGASVIKMIPASIPKMRKLSIMREVKIRWIRLTSILSSLLSRRILVRCLDTSPSSKRLCIERSRLHFFNITFISSGNGCCITITTCDTRYMDDNRHS